MGRKTSVYIPDDLAEALAVQDVPLAEVIRRGLGIAAEDVPVPVTAWLRPETAAALDDARGDESRSAWLTRTALRALLAEGHFGRADEPEKPPAAPEPPPAPEPAPARARRTAVAQDVRRCAHPGTRVIGGWCGQCGAHVLPGGRFRDDAEGGA